MNLWILWWIPGFLNENIGSVSIKPPGCVIRKAAPVPESTNNWHIWWSRITFMSYFEEIKESANLQSGKWIGKIWSQVSKWQSHCMEHAKQYGIYGHNYFNFCKLLGNSLVVMTQRAHFMMSLVFLNPNSANGTPPSMQLFKASSLPLEWTNTIVAQRLVILSYMAISLEDNYTRIPSSCQMFTEATQSWLSKICSSLLEQNR